MWLSCVGQAVGCNGSMSEGVRMRPALAAGLTALTPSAPLRLPPFRGPDACRLAEASIRTRVVPRSRSGASDTPAGAAASDHLPRFGKEGSAEPRFMGVGTRRATDADGRPASSTDRLRAIRVSTVPTWYGPLPPISGLIGMSAPVDRMAMSREVGRDRVADAQHACRGPEGGRLTARPEGLPRADN